MKELKELYDALIKGLKTDHDNWVASNRKMRSIESALQQIKDIGDTPSNPAKEVLKQEYTRETAKNVKATTRLYDRKEMIREIERFARDRGEDWNGTYEIFGY